MNSPILLHTVNGQNVTLAPHVSPQGTICPPFMSIQCEGTSIYLTLADAMVLRNHLSKLTLEFAQSQQGNTDSKNPS